MEERSTDKLARYIIYAATIAIIAAICWYFRSILIYIILAAVLSLIGRPVKRLLSKIHIKGKSMPDWLLAILTLIIIILIFLGIITQLIPVVSGIINNISDNLKAASASGTDISAMLANFNTWLVDKFPNLGSDFKIENKIIESIRNAFDISSVSSMVGSVASTLGNIGIGIFATIFISFFFIRDEKLFRNIIGSLVPDKHEANAIAAIGDIEHLLSRYFVGLVIEVLGVALLNFLGLWLVAKVGLSAAIGIAFMTGILNIIPYVGPWIGGAIGTILGLVIKYSQAAAIGSSPNLLIITGILVAVFVFTQLIDNFIYQPFIYSTSIKSSPLEIFIVLLIAGQVGGIFGMLVAVPAYTVVRVIAGRFFGDFKPIKRLISNQD